MQSDDSKAGDGKRSAVLAGTLVVLASLGLVAYLVAALQPASPAEIAEVIAAATGLLTAAAGTSPATRADSWPKPASISSRRCSQLRLCSTSIRAPISPPRELFTPAARSW